MVNFPKVPSHPRLALTKMQLCEYARFSEYCLKSNPAITPENCLSKRVSEKMMKKPFRLRVEGR